LDTGTCASFSSRYVTDDWLLMCPAGALVNVPRDVSMQATHTYTVEWKLRLADDELKGYGRKR
jgi:hypothetical protein